MGIAQVKIKMKKKRVLLKGNEILKFILSMVESGLHL